MNAEGALYAGAITTGVIALLPYINVFLFPAYAIGAVVGVWFAVSKLSQSLTPKQAAKLGFLSAFLGSMAAIFYIDIIWQFFDYQLWEKQNSQLMIALFRSFASRVDCECDVRRDGTECRRTVRMVHGSGTVAGQRSHVRNFWNGRRTDH